jgi:uncharacterized membrane protein HdeD (DUF308 family)
MVDTGSQPVISPEPGKPAPAPAPPTTQWWPYILGAVLIALGLLAFVQAYRGGGNNPLLFGILLLTAGISEGVHAIFDRSWTEFVSELTPSLLFVIGGIVILADPLTGSFMLTLLISAALVTGTAFRISSAFRERPLRGWQMLVVAAVVSVLVWLLLLLTWPASGGWVLGTIAGIVLGWTGIEWIRRGYRARTARELL